MRLLFKYLIFGIVCLLPFTGFARDVSSQSLLRIADFQDPNMSENIGVWVHNILDPDQNLKFEITQQDDGQKKALRLDYDVDSPSPAMVGFWMNLRNQDLREFNTLHLRLKAGGEEHFLGNIAFQFTDADHHKAAYLVSRIPTEWKEFQVSLRNFKRIHNWSEIKEFEIIIDDINAKPKEGILLIDEIYVSKDR